MAENIYLIGFMGTGKTTVSQQLAGIYNCRELDMDQEIERREGMGITSIFKEKGEAYFRGLETALLKELKDAFGLLISCGGGAAMREENVAAMKQGGIVLLLTAELETVYERVRKGKNRPLLSENMNVPYIKELMDKREPAYQAAADILVSTDGKSPAKIAGEIYEKIENFKKIKKI